MFVESALADAVLRGLVLSLAGLFWVILLVRVLGLRSFSKLTNFDLAMTIARGSLIAGAGQAETGTRLVQVMAARAALFGAQWALSRGMRISGTFNAAVQNTPAILVRDGEILRETLAEQRISEHDLLSKLREAGVGDVGAVRVAVLETTGEISVLTGSAVSARLLEGVRGA